MIVLVIGGSGSGKSEFAETICMELPAEEKCYIATMQAFDEESRARIAKHRKARSGKGFETIEQGTHLEAVCLPGGCTALLECMSNLVANEMYDPEGAQEKTAEQILQGILHLKSRAKNLCVVTNEVFSDGKQYDADTMRYLSYLGKINCEMAKMADEVYEVVYGIPLQRKWGQET